MMLRYIPSFILQNFEENVFQGSLQAYVLLFDIADFTAIGTTLQKAGKPGAEELSRFLDMVFGESISIVQQYGGFVSLFAGDAFCAIFPMSDQETGNLVGSDPCVRPCVSAGSASCSTGLACVSAVNSIR